MSESFEMRLLRSLKLPRNNRKDKYNIINIVQILKLLIYAS